MLRTAFALLAVAAVAAAADMKPFEIEWRADSGVLADVSFLLEAPAGKQGFITTRNGHLAQPDGSRFRIWGTNFSFVANMPDKAEAPHVAAHLARFGVNCVRIHHLDWRVPRGIIDSRFPDSRHLDPDGLDRLDYFISELKKKGIYVNINLNVARAFQEGDGVKDADQLGFGKGVTLFDPKIIELEKEYAKTLLAHKNPYIGTEYRNEPAVAVVEIVNENSLIENWMRGRLLGKGPGTNQDRTWTDLPASYERDLTALYNKWLREKLPAAEVSKIAAEAGVATGSEIPRLRPDQFAAASPFRFRTEASFYMDTEDRFFQTMYSYLKRDLNVKSVIVATSAHAGGMSPYPLLSSTAKLDMLDAHTYWQHPRYLSDPVTGRRTGFEIQNTPSVNEPERSAVVTLARSAVAGKPFMVSEVNHPYPSEYASEGVPLIAAYGAFQDWDAVFWYSFAHAAAQDWSKPARPSAFDIRNEPVKMTQWVAGALLFLRGDVATAKKVLTRSYTHEQVTDSLRLPSKEMPYFTPGLPSTAALVHGSRVAAFDAKQSRIPDVQVSSPFRSDTGELEWSNESGKGLVSVNTDRTQALVGYFGSRAAKLDNLEVSVKNEFGSIMLNSLDPQPITKARRLLLTTGGRVGNKGMKWNEKRTTTADPGEPGTLIEVFEGTVTLRGVTAKAVELVALDGAGRALGQPVSGQKTAAGWQLPIGQTVTPWYLIRVTR